jgi:cytochrome c oxidase cbb3-type subunit III
VPTKIEKDVITGKDTTGHEWDGLKELDTPLPRWWINVWIVTIVFSLGYMLLYPSIPLGTTYFGGLLGWNSQKAVTEAVAVMDARHAADMKRIGELPVMQVAANPQLKEVAMQAGRIAFAENCQPCHGPGGVGRVGYPPLDTDFWLWGGTLPDIQRIIEFGIRSGDPKAHDSQMPAFGHDGILKPEQVTLVSHYVATLFGIEKAGPTTEAGKKIYADNCAACHGDKGQGNRQVGAPPLASRVHLYGGTLADIEFQVNTPRAGVMPAWHTRFDQATINSLAIYVHGLGGGE